MTVDRFVQFCKCFYDYFLTFFVCQFLSSSLLSVSCLSVSCLTTDRCLLVFSLILRMDYCEVPDNRTAL